MLFRSLHERLCPLKDRGPEDVDFVVFRENTEGVYVNVGGRFKPGTDDEVAVQEEINTFKGVYRIIRHAFEYAVAHQLTKVCMADKSNAMTHGHALWQRVFWDLAEALVPRGRAYDFNQALMDFGATWCTPRRPRCGACTMRAFCKSAGRV